ncbi:MAG: hypothetical protein DWC04_06055 [Candidatus Poseidoniales archaeon]|nr:MAG: hypothetical protein DWC04_06055 [Candidatus Poseidoniales archaeon]
MRAVRFFGNPDLNLDWLQNEGWTIFKHGGDGSRVLVCTFDNQATDPRERLGGTIAPMCKAMNHVRQGSVDRVVLVTDGAGYAGTRRVAKYPSSATFIDEHGMGSLTSEILASIATEAGANVSIIRGIPEHEEEVRKAIIDALK